MELSERVIAKLESQGYSSIEEQQYAPGSSVSPAPLATTVTMYITDGSANITFGGVVCDLNLGESVIIQAPVAYTLTAGPAGCQITIGEK